MDLLQGDTPKAKHDYLVALILKDVSDRDQFAIGYYKWVVLNYDAEEATRFTYQQLLDLYKKSLKTDKA